MKIHWYGHSCFLLEWGDLRIVTDPYDGSVGYDLPVGPAEIVTVSHDHFDHNNVQGVSGNPEVIRGAGPKPHPALGQAGVKLTGIHSFHDKEEGRKRGSNTIFRFDGRDFSLAHLGDLGQSLSPSITQALTGLDLLLIPVGGTFTIDGDEAFLAVQELQPKMVIPMHFQTSKLQFKLDSADRFLKHFTKVEEAGLPWVEISEKQGESSGAPRAIVLECGK